MKVRPRPLRQAAFTIGAKNWRDSVQVWQAWAPLVTLPALVILGTPPDWPRWIFMWLLAGAIFAGCKWLTWRLTPVPDAPWWRHAGYLCAWPGMDARRFLTEAPSQEERPGRREWALAWAKCAAGAVLLWGAARLALAGWELAAGWAGMVGIVTVLHFGVFHVLSCGWRRLGVRAAPLMSRPLEAESVGSFWGRSWNTAFRDLTHRFLFRPLRGALGARGALLTGFIISGLIHELVISLPARGGFGLPTLFFLAQAGAILFERSATGRRLGLGQGLRGRLFVLTAVALPAYALFHPPFVRAVILPFMGALGAL